MGVSIRPSKKVSRPQRSDADNAGLENGTNPLWRIWPAFSLIRGALRPMFYIGGVLLCSVVAPLNALAADCAPTITTLKPAPTGIQQAFILASDSTNQGGLANSCDPYAEGIYATEVEAGNGDSGVAYPIPANQISGISYGTYSIDLSSSEEAIYYTPSSSPGVPYSNTLTLWTYDSELNVVSETLTVNVPLLAVSGPPVAGAVNEAVPYDAAAEAITLSLTGGPPTSVTVVSPASHGVASASGVSISYTPTVGFYGNDTFSYVAANSFGQSLAANASLTILAPTISVAPTSLAAGKEGSVYSQSLSVSGGQPPYTFSSIVSNGSLPEGLSLSNTGTIAGIPTLACNCTFTVNGTDSSTTIPRMFTSATMSLAILPAVPSITSIMPALGMASGGATVTLAGSGFTPSCVVRFGGVVAADVTFLSSTSLAVVAPAGVGVVDITVQTIAGVSIVSAADQFTYVTEVAAQSAPVGVAVDGRGALYVADAGQTYIVRIPPNCTALACESIVGGSFTAPVGVAVDGGGALYVLSGGTNGTLTKLEWNSYSGNYGEQVVIATGLSLPTKSPSGVAVDSKGNVFLTDTNNKQIIELLWNAAARIYSVQRVLLTTSGTSEPTGIAVDADGTSYIADPGLQTISRREPSGEVKSLVTSVHASNVALDNSGNLYYSDSETGTVNKLPGTGGPPEPMATALGLPYGLAIDESGNIFVASTTSKAIVKLTVTAPPTLTFSNTAVGAVSVDSPMIATLANIGNAPLVFAPLTGGNPVVSSGFRLSSATTCPEMDTGSVAQALAQSASCQYAISFAPTLNNPYSGSLVITDNDLEARVASQSIELRGNGVADDVSSVLLTTNPASPVVFGDPITITATVLDVTSAGVSPSGYIDFQSKDGVSTLSTISPSVSLEEGSASVMNYKPAHASTYTITATYTGVLGSIASSLAESPIVVAKASPRLAYTPATLTQIYGDGVPAGALDATAVGVDGLPLPGTFTYSTVADSIVTHLESGSTVLPVGSYVLSATFTPSDTTDYVAGSIVPSSTSLTVNEGSATVMLGSLDQVYSAAGHSATAVTVPPDLSITFTYNGSRSEPISPGSYSVLATVNDVNYTGSAGGTLVIAQASPQAISVTSSINPVLIEGSVTFSAIVGSIAGTPTGFVAFVDGSNTLGVSPLVNGVAAFSTSALAIGPHLVTAVYRGDPDFLPLSSSAFTETVMDFVLGIPSGTSPVTTVATQPGGTASYSLGISPTGSATFPATVTFSVTGVPPGATYTLTPSQIAAGSGATNVILFIKLAQNAGDIRNRAPIMAPMVVALVLLPLAGCRRFGQRHRFHVGRLLLLVIVVLGLGGCANDGDGASQQRQVYLVTVTATSGPLVHSTTLTLTVL